MEGGPDLDPGFLRPSVRSFVRSFVRISGVSFGLTFPEEMTVLGASRRPKTITFFTKSDHLRNRTSVEKYFDTGTVSQVVTFHYRERKNGLQDGPKSGISSGNISPN